MPRSPWLSRKDTKTNRYLKSEDSSAIVVAQLPPGILNCANDCFANSVLQSLIATPPLEDMIRFRRHVGKYTPRDPALSPALTNGRAAAGIHEAEWIQGLNVSDTFLQFMENAYHARESSSAKPLNPRDIIRALGAKFDQYLDFRQQDAHELLRHLLDAMYMEEMDVAKQRQPQSDPNARWRKARRLAERPFSGRSPAESTTNVSTPVIEDPRLEPFSSTVFGGRLASIIVCNTCKHISHTYEDFMDLSLPIKAEDLKKKSAFRAFAERFTTSLAPSAAPSRPTTPNPVTPDAIMRVDSPQPPPNAHLAGNHDSDYVSQPGRTVPTRLNRSRERFDQFRTGTRPGSRSTSADAHVRAPKQKKRSAKPTPGEAAYLRALLRDEPSHINPLSVLRGGVAPPASATGPPSNERIWGRIGSTTNNLLDCLRIFTSVEILDGDNSFACHNCWKIANPDVKRRRQTRDKSPGPSPSSSSSDDDEEQIERETVPKSNGLLRPDMAPTRSISADVMRTGSSGPVPPFLQRPASWSPLPNLSSTPTVTLDKTPTANPGGDVADLTNLLPSSVPGSAAPMPFPSIEVPSILTSLASPVTTSPREGASSVAYPDSDTISPVPRFRRFSSFHAEKFFSPNVSRESLASAPPEEGVHAMLRRQLMAPESAVASDTEDSTNGGEVDVQSTAAESAVTSQTDLSLGVNGVLDKHKKDNELSRRPGVLAPFTPLATERYPKGSMDLTFSAATVEDKQGRLLRVKRADQIILRHAFKRYLIDVPPPVLVIHLKRFQQLHQSAGGLFAGGAKKLEDFISFPEFLDLRPFLAPRKEKYGLNERGRTSRQHLDPRRGLGAKQGRHPHHHWSWSDGKEDEEPPVIYRLYAVVVHIGSMLGGHYIAYAALPDSRAAAFDKTENHETETTFTDALSTVSEAPPVGRRSNPPADTSASNHKAVGASVHDAHHHRPNIPAPRKWCYVSDATVRIASLEEVLKQKAYLLFYERVP